MLQFTILILGFYHPLLTYNRIDLFFFFDLVECYKKIVVNKILSILYIKCAHIHCIISVL